MVVAAERNIGMTQTGPTSGLASGTVPASAVGGGFAGRRAAEIVGISYRQLDYWARTDLLRPSLMDAAGSGSRRLYSYSDLLELKVIKSLLDAGIKLEQVRSVFSYLRDQLGEDIATANLVISGTSSVLVRNGDELIDAVRSGQGVLNVLPLGGVKDELDAAIVEFPGKSAPASGRRTANGDAESAGSAASAEQAV